MASGKWTETTLKNFLDATCNSDVLLADGFEEAFLGLTYPVNSSGAVAVYDILECINVLKRRDSMSTHEAEEFFEFNVGCAYVGPKTPVFLDRYSIPKGTTNAKLKYNSPLLKRHGKVSKNQSNRRKGARKEN